MEISIAVVLILAVSASRRDLQERRDDFFTVIGFLLYGVLGSRFLLFLGSRLQRSYDVVFLRADAALGFNPIRFAELASHHGLLMIVLILSYSLLPATIGAAWALEHDKTMRTAILLGGCVCFIFYGALPAVGPGHFDWHHGIALNGSPPNCIPSMHFTWALLIAVNAHSRRLRLALWIYAALVAMATIALREHYLVDLVAATPYTFAIQWIAARLGSSQKSESFAARVWPRDGDADAL